MAEGKNSLTYAQAGVEGLLKDATRPPGRKPLTAAVIQRVLHLTLHEKPPRATHWSVRSMAAVTGLSHTSVQLIWHLRSQNFVGAGLQHCEH